VTLRAPWCLLAFCLAACSPAYVLRAGYEEAKILCRRQPIERLLRRDDLDAETRTKLELVLAVRAFARDTLGLTANNSYTTYARVDADQVVHVVTAAYRTRLEPYTWWFPIVGRVPYKGYFSQTAAEAEAAELERDGYDTAVRPSVAFSTLGWFADPLLSSLLRYDRVTLAEVIIHELLHNTAYFGGHADFDESFATFVGMRGAMAFFAAHNDTTAFHQAAVVWDDSLRFSDFLVEFTTRLRHAYSTGIDSTERQRLFNEGQQTFRHLGLHTGLYAEFGTEALNNANILHYLMYADRLRAFDDALHQRQGDLAATVATILHAVRADGGDPFGAVKQLLESHGTALPHRHGSVEASRRMPYRVERTNTATARVSAATNEATTLDCRKSDRGSSLTRLEKITYTGQASRTTTAPMKDMHRIMYTKPPMPAAILDGLSASNLGNAAPTANPRLTIAKVMPNSVSTDSHIMNGITFR
jgi:predicted aminopeptidase